MKDWLEITRLYEKDSIYLAEAAQIMVRNIQYELPSVKKQTNRFEQLIEEAEKTIHDQTTSETMLHAQRMAMCQKLGISGNNLREELTEKLTELSKFHAEIVRLTDGLNEPLKLYASATQNNGCLPLVRHVIAKGNTTVYEYIHGEAPLSIKEPTTELKISVANSFEHMSNADEVKYCLAFEVCFSREMLLFIPLPLVELD